MENSKKNLAKTALAALVLAASLPVAGQATTGTEVQGALLARGCNAKVGPASCGATTSRNTNPSFGHGCGSACGASSQSQASQDSNMGHHIPQNSSNQYEQQGMYRSMGEPMHHPMQSAEGVQHSCGGKKNSMGAQHSCGHSSN